MLTQQRALELFEYKDGRIYWKVDMHTRKYKGRVAGTVTPKGYIVVTVGRKNYRVHRVVFLMHHGYAPPFIDHINGDKADNRIENLRAANKRENAWNQVVRCSNTSGYKGVSLNRKLNKWCAYLSIDGKRKHLGVFESKDDAAEAVRVAREKHHGEFTRHK
jgi:hypothetical protein